MKRPHNIRPGSSPHKTLRQQLAFSLEDQAFFYGISISALAMMEKGHRTLPGRATMLSVSLEKAFQKARKQLAEGGAAATKVPAIDAAELESVVLRLELEISKLKKQLDRKRYLMESALRLKMVCEDLRPQFQDPSTVQFIKIEEWEATARYRLAENHPSLIRIMEMQLTNKQKELKEFQKILAG